MTVLKMPKLLFPWTDVSCIVHNFSLICYKEQGEMETWRGLGGDKINERPGPRCQDNTRDLDTWNNVCFVMIHLWLSTIHASISILFRHEAQHPAPRCVIWHTNSSANYLYRLHIIFQHFPIILVLGNKYLLLSCHL